MVRRPKEHVSQNLGRHQVPRRHHCQDQCQEPVKLVVAGGEPGELFDLHSDPREFYNRIADPACADTIADLHARLQAWERANRP